METKETSFGTFSQQRLIDDTEFYKYIFKKTEKIACAVFYILRSDEYVSQTDIVITDLEKTAMQLLNVSLKTLKTHVSYVDTHAREIQHALIELESRLRIAHASRLLRDGYLEVFLHEIESVQRMLRKYIESGNTRSPFAESGSKVEIPKERKVPVLRKAPENREVAGGGVSYTPSRRERILNVIKDRGEATIKDISTLVTDCSEKTIQRELISLINDNVVHRDGERRWSKYKLI